MRIVDIIQNKRDGIELTDEEIKFLLTEYYNGKVPDYQMSSFLMATYFKDMTDKELVTFTMTMRDSGDIINFPELDRYLVDKHSTGGVGDKVTVVLAPILSALGMATAKLSGKGLGHTGGTIDKFESIENFQFSNTKEELALIANKTGVGLMGYSDKIVPLDKKIYALRDVTATVPSIPLIASSIMSKKLAIQSDVIILDVKVGDGAFMKTLDDAKMLAKRMIAIGEGANRKVKVVISNMDEPLGFNIGNSTEIIEGIEALKGNWSEDLKEVVYTIASLALKSKGEIKNIKEGYELIDKVISSGKALNLFKDFIRDIYAENSGFVHRIKTEEIGKAAMVIGAGRETKESIIDHAVGIKILKKVGDKVEKGDLIAQIFYNDNKNIENSKDMLLDSYVIDDMKISKMNPILDIIE